MLCRPPVGQHKHVLEADAYSVTGRDRRGEHLPRPLAVAVPQLPDLVRDPPRDRARLVGATADLDERTQNLVSERAPRELVGLVGCGEAGLDRDPRVPRGADDARPAELGQVDRDEVGRRRHARTAAARANGSGSIAADVDSPTGNPGAAARIAATTASHAAAAIVWARERRAHARAPRTRRPANRDRVGRELRRRLRNSRVLGARAPAVQAGLDRYQSATIACRSRGSRRRYLTSSTHAVAIDLSVPGVEEMHQRAGAKWAAYDADVLSATIAEMDFPLAPPVADALRHAIDRGDLGYPAPATPTSAAPFARFAARRVELDGRRGADHARS